MRNRKNKLRKKNLGTKKQKKTHAEIIKTFNDIAFDMSIPHYYARNFDFEKETKNIKSSVILTEFLTSTLTPLSGRESLTITYQVQQFFFEQTKLSSSLSDIQKAIDTSNEISKEFYIRLLRKFRFVNETTSVQPATRTPQILQMTNYYTGISANYSLNTIDNIPC